VFETLTLEEKRSARAGVPGEFEVAPTIVRVRLFVVVTELLQGCPDAAEQIVKKLLRPSIEYSTNRLADADAGHRSGAAPKAATAINFLFIMVNP
jgi:hypothetical protein